MTKQKIKQYLNKTVYYKSGYEKLEKYKLIGVTIRKDKTGYVYYAELQDIQSPWSVIIVNLEGVDIEPE